jgi:hypothetical protein
MDLTGPTNFDVMVVIRDHLFRVMIEYHSKIQLFTTLPMWQGGPPLLFEYF